MSGQFSGTDAGNANLTITDGTDTGYGINKIIVSAGTLSGIGNGQCAISTGGGGGGSGTVTSIAASGGLSGGTITTTGTITTKGVLQDLNTVGAPSADGEFLVATGAGAFAYESGATARTSLGAASSGANSDITSLSGLTTDLSIAQGGTGASSATDALANLGGLPSIANIIATAASSPLQNTKTGSIYFVDTGGGNITLELPTGVLGTQWVVFRATAGNNIVIDGTANSVTINGASTYTLSATQYQAATIFAVSASTYYAIG